MNCSRRDLSLLLPALAAAAPGSGLASKSYRFEDLPVRVNGANKSRAVLSGATHTGFAVETHQTELGPGQAPHPPHHHAHEEIVFLREGTLEVTIMGQVSRIGPGGVVYVASNEEHGWKNAGTTPAHYFVLALGRQP
jgi:quercetin dioxygenase-like cupin family protein